MDSSKIGQRWSPTQVGRFVAPEPGLAFGGIELVRPLSRHRLASRWLARDAQGEARLLYQIDGLAGAKSSRAFRLALEQSATLRHPHVLPIHRLDTEHVGGRWLVCAYPGTLSGIVSVGSVAQQRDGGVLKPVEVRWVMEQLLGAVSFAHGAGHCHGEVFADEVCIDRRGSIVMELYGVARRLRRLPTPSVHELALETRSVLELGFLLATGRRWKEVGPEAWRSVGVGRELRGWFEAGLAAQEFIGAEEARRALVA